MSKESKAVLRELVVLDDMPTDSLGRVYLGIPWEDNPAGYIAVGRATSGPHRYRRARLRDILPYLELDERVWLGAALEARERKLKDESPVEKQIRAASQKIWDRLHPEGVHQ